jgi:hypothetical protein
VSRFVPGDRVLLDSDPPYDGPGTVVQAEPYDEIVGVHLDAFTDPERTVLCCDRELEAEEDLDPDPDVEDGSHEWAHGMGTTP